MAAQADNVLSALAEKQGLPAVPARDTVPHFPKFMQPSPGGTEEEVTDAILGRGRAAPGTKRGNALDFVPGIGEARGVAAGVDAMKGGGLAGSLGALGIMGAMLPGVGAKAGKLPRIAKAAIKLENGAIHWGSSHYSAVERANLPYKTQANILSKAIEGFTDESGAFLTRDETTQRLKDLGSKLGGGGMTSEEMRFMSPKNRAKLMVPDYELPHQGTRTYEDSYPAQAKTYRTQGKEMKPVPGRNAFETNKDYQKRIGGIADSVVARGNPEVQSLLQGMQTKSGAKNMPRISVIDTAMARMMAKEYDKLPTNDPNAREAYRALNSEVAAQKAALEKAGYTFEFVDHDPYKSSKEMMADVAATKRLKVFKTQGDQTHPFMTNDQNNDFRGVHDLLAHAGEGHQFGPMGEENAYRVHASTLSADATRALASETRGQNSWVNFGPNANLPARERPFAEQKSALWPAHLTGDYSEMKAPVVQLGPTKKKALDDMLSAKDRQVQATAAARASALDALRAQTTHLDPQDADELHTLLGNPYTPYDNMEATLRNSGHAPTPAMIEAGRAYQQATNANKEAIRRANGGLF